eukprot:728061-Amphidinium_carterae.1
MRRSDAVQSLTYAALPRDMSNPPLAAIAAHDAVAPLILSHLGQHCFSLTYQFPTIIPHDHQHSSH